MFTFSEADHSAMRAYVSAQLEEEQLDGISLVSEGTNSGTSELDALRKKAKLCGVAFTDATGKYELQFKIEYVDKFAQTRYGSSAVASISTLLLPTAPTVYSDSDDIDGVPLDSGEMSSTGGDEGSGGGAHRQSLTQLEKLLHSEHSTAVDSEYDDDIDGVPLTIGEYSIPVSSQPPPNL